ncbi:hypothetical protein NLG97_g7286 [Lecanicillium saksenae]|uniref:Uncharacterized protein n=1 Tax=Lecanicillium saksenae TaxID=468837 RepID=A0ACC1QM87_9HYPO|nr:hypothetical protein NLG97_g7286 [Lecanicillium saksenae]
METTNASDAASREDGPRLPSTTLLDAERLLAMLHSELKADVDKLDKMHDKVIANNEKYYRLARKHEQQAEYNKFLAAEVEAAAALEVLKHQN